LLPTIRIIDSSEMRRVTEFMKAFELASQYVTVDVNHATRVYAEMIESGHAIVFIMENDGVILGSLGCISAPDLHNGMQTLVETFWFTHPDSRGQGLLLLNAFESYAANNGIKKVAMIHMTDSYPERLEKLYVKRGYTLIEKHYVKEVS